jgi:hemerythrin-like domain-containing protein
MAEHEQIVNLCGELRRAVGAGEDTAIQQAVTTLRAALQPHTGSEERSLFAQLRRDPEFTEHVDSLCGEHQDLATLLGAVEHGDLATFGRFEELLRRHMDREDNGLFPAAAIALGGPEWEWVTENA